MLAGPGRRSGGVITGLGVRPSKRRGSSSEDQPHGGTFPAAARSSLLVQAAHSRPGGYWASAGLAPALWWGGGRGVGPTVRRVTSAVNPSEPLDVKVRPRCDALRRLVPADLPDGLIG